MISPLVIRLSLEFFVNNLLYMHAYIVLSVVDLYMSASLML